MSVLNLNHVVDRLAAAVEALIELIDILDGDADLEDNHDHEALNEDGGDIVDEPHDDDPAEEDDPPEDDSEDCEHDGREPEDAV